MVIYAQINPAAGYWLEKSENLPDGTNLGIDKRAIKLLKRFHLSNLHLVG